jgi:hypothetical protein
MMCLQLLQRQSDIIICQRIANVVRWSGPVDCNSCQVGVSSLRRTIPVDFLRSMLNWLSPGDDVPPAATERFGRNEIKVLQQESQLTNGLSTHKLLGRIALVISGQNAGRFAEMLMRFATSRSWCISGIATYDHRFRYFERSWQKAHLELER